MLFVPNKSRDAAFLFILITVALDMLALGVMIPVLPKLVIEFAGDNLRSATIITGAGGIITAWDGGAAKAGGRIIAAGDKRVHEAAMKLLNG